MYRFTQKMPFFPYWGSNRANRCFLGVTVDFRNLLNRNRNNFDMSSSGSLCAANKCFWYFRQQTQDAGETLILNQLITGPWGGHICNTFLYFFYFFLFNPLSEKFYIKILINHQQMDSNDPPFMTQARIINKEI